MGSNFRRYFQFALVVLAAGAIFPIVYLRTNYQETILTVFDMTLPQLNIIYSVLGIVFMIGYFPSGLLSDKFSAKKLLWISLLGTALGGFWFAQIPSYQHVVFIFIIWGTFSVFTFWSAHMKLVKMMAKPEEEGRFFGILDGGRGVVEAVLASVAVVIFAGILGASTAIDDMRSALIAVIYMYSFVLLACAVLVFLFVEEDSGGKNTKQVDQPEAAQKEKFKLADLSLLFKNKLVFVMGGIIFMGYSVFWTVYYFGGFMETNLSVDAITVGQITVIVLWMRPIGGTIGGILADKIGKTKSLGGSLIGAAICLVLISILPVYTYRTVFFALIIICGLFLYAIRGTYWSLLGDLRMGNKVMGVTIGFVSVLGYTPDILLPLINSGLFATFGDHGGYNAYFIMSAIFGVIGVMLVILFGRMTRKNCAQTGI